MFSKKNYYNRKTIEKDFVVAQGPKVLNNHYVKYHLRPKVKYILLLLIVIPALRVDDNPPFF
jgi:hypothetical protein